MPARATTVADVIVVEDEVPLASLPPPFTAVSGLGAAPSVGALPPKEAPTLIAADPPTAASTSKKPSLSWAQSVFDMGLSRKLVVVLPTSMPWRRPHSAC